jgi:hypothetical protein
LANLAGLCQAARFYHRGDEQSNEETIEEMSSLLPLANEVPGWQDAARERVYNSAQHQDEIVYAGGSTPAGDHVPLPAHAQPARSAMKGGRSKAQRQNGASESF